MKKLFRCFIKNGRAVGKAMDDADLFCFDEGKQRRYAKEIYRSIMNSAD